MHHQGFFSLHPPQVCPGDMGLAMNMLKPVSPFRCPLWRCWCTPVLLVCFHHEHKRWSGILFASFFSFKGRFIIHCSPCCLWSQQEWTVLLIPTQYWDHLVFQKGGRCLILQEGWPLLPHRLGYWTLCLVSLCLTQPPAESPVCVCRVILPLTHLDSMYLHMPTPWWVRASPLARRLQLQLPEALPGECAGEPGLTRARQAALLGHWGGRMNNFHRSS